MHIEIIILNFRVAEMMVNGLQALANQIEASTHKINISVVDNASGDGSAEIIQQYIIDHQWHFVSFIQRDSNDGFSIGNNQKIRQLVEVNQCDYVWILNPDTLVLPTMLDKLISYLVEYPIDIVGTRLEDRDGTVQNSSFNFPTPFGEFLSQLSIGIVSRLFSGFCVVKEQSDQVSVVDWVAGASIVIKLDVFKEIGLFDEGYFLYYEEVDFLLRAKKRGYNCWYLPFVRVIHHVGAATKISDNRKHHNNRRPKYWFDSRRRYFVKNLGFIRAILSDILWIAGHVLNRIRLIFGRKKTDMPPYILLDFMRFSTLFRGWKT